MSPSHFRFAGSLLAGTVLNILGFGQSLVAPERIAAVRTAFEAAASPPQLRCEIHPVRPALNFAFRFETGYSVDIPLGQLRGSGRRLNMRVRVTPSGREPIYLTQAGVLPEVPETKAEGITGGAFIVGEGTYDVAVLVEDELHRSCRGAWQIQARRTGSERQLEPATPAGAVSEIASGRPPVGVAKSGPRIANLTILLHAAPLSPNLSKIQPDDIQLLLDSLSSLLRELPARSLRLIAFNLDQQAIIYRQDCFTANQMSALTSALKQMKWGLVDYRTLRDRQEPIYLLRELIQAELRNPKPPNALIVLGPRTRTWNNIPADSLGKRPAAAPPIFALQCHVDPPIQPGRSDRPFRRGQGLFSAENSDRPPSYEMDADGVPREGLMSPELPGAAELPDSIQRLVSRFKGNTIPVHTPHDLADAIRRMDSRIPKIAAPVEPTDTEGATLRPPEARVRGTD